MKSIIYITSRRLLPLDSGDKILSFNILKKINKEKKIILLNLNEGLEYSDNELFLIKNICSSFIYHQYTYEHSLIKKVKSILMNTLYWKIKVDNFNYMHNWIQKEISKIENIEYIVWDHLRTSLFYIDNSHKNILIEHNNETEIMKKRLLNTQNYIFKILLKQQVSLMNDFVAIIHKNMDKIISLNKEDFLHCSYTDSKKYIVMNYLLLEFEHQPYRIKKRENTINILFVGSLDWYPNIEAIKWFITKVIPILKQNNLNFEFNIVGRSPNKSLINFIASAPNTRLNMNVPSINKFYLNSDIFVAPINTGSGINIKILESLSYGIPIVLTEYAKRGYPDLDFIKNSNNEKEFAENILKFQDINEREQLHKKLLKYYSSYQKKSSQVLNKIFIE